MIPEQNDPAEAPAVLLPCPFCGNPEPILCEPHPECWRVGCARCGSYNNYSRGTENAVNRWNTRAGAENVQSVSSAQADTDDYQVRRVLLQCCSRLRLTNLADIDDCRTMDVAEMLESQLATLRTRYDEVVAERDRLKANLASADSEISNLKEELRDAQNRPVE